MPNRRPESGWCCGSRIRCPSGTYRGMNPLFGFFAVLVARPIVRALETIWGRIAAAAMIISVACIIAFSVGDKPYSESESYAFLSSQNLFLLAFIVIPVIVCIMAYCCYVVFRMFRKIPEEAYQRSLYDRMWWKVTLAGQPCRPARISIYGTFLVLKTVYKTYNISLDAIRSLKQPISSMINRTPTVQVFPKDPAQFPPITLRGKKSVLFHTALARLLHKRHKRRRR